jgi:hypothetical protein
MQRYINERRDLPGYDLHSLREMVMEIDTILDAGGVCTVSVSPTHAETGAKDVSVRITAFVPRGKAYAGVTAAASSGYLTSMDGGAVRFVQESIGRNGQVVFTVDAFLDGRNSQSGTTTISILVGGAPCASTAFEWKEADAPTIRYFKCIKEKHKIFLTWSVEGAERVDIAGCTEGCTRLDPKNGSIRIPIPQNVETATFTLTARRGKKEARKTDTVQLKGKKPISGLILTSPKSGSYTTDGKVRVKGRMSPPPSEGTGEATIYVEGQPAGTALIDSRGAFDFPVFLVKKAKKEQLQLQVPKITIKECGDRTVSLVFSLLNNANPQETENRIDVIVNGDRNLKASTVVMDVPQVIKWKPSARVRDAAECLCEDTDWAEVPENKPMPVLPPDPVEFEYAVIKSKYYNMDDTCTCRQKLEVHTTVGVLEGAADYTVNINNPCR